MKPTLLAGLALIADAGTTFAFAEHIVLLDAARFLQGVGGACAWVGAFRGWSRPRRPSGAARSSAPGLAAAIFRPAGARARRRRDRHQPGARLLPRRERGLGPGRVTLGMDAVAPSPFPGWRRVESMLTSLPIAAVWLTALPAIFSGMINVLAPLRLDHLGATGFVAGVFAVGLIEGAPAVVRAPVGSPRSPVAIRIRLVVAAAMAIWLPIPDAIVVLGIGVVVAEVQLRLCWTPAMSGYLDSIGAFRSGQWLAFGLVNLAWASGMVLEARGAARWPITSDTLPLALVAALPAPVRALLRAPAGAGGQAGGAFRVNSAAMLGGFPTSAPACSATPTRATRPGWRVASRPSSTAAACSEVEIGADHVIVHYGRRLGGDDHHRGTGAAPEILVNELAGVAASRRWSRARGASRRAAAGPRGDAPGPGERRRRRRRRYGQDGPARAGLRARRARAWDAIVVGGGHNGLTAAAYLARCRPVGARARAQRAAGRGVHARAAVSRSAAT